MLIFIPLLGNFCVDPLFFGLLLALNLQAAFLRPAHVALNQICAGMLPFMGIQVIAIALLYPFPAIGLGPPQVLYK
jgi:TRAP-type mannitol/chloroaromatic compound transport system permease large subunit